MSNKVWKTCTPIINRSPLGRLLFENVRSRARAGCVFRNCPRGKKRTPNISCTERSSRQNGLQGGPPGTLGDPWGALRDSFGGCGCRRGPQGKLRRPSFANRRSCKFNGFTYEWVHFGCQRDLGASSSRRLSTKGGPRGPLGGKGAPKAEGRQARKAQRGPKGSPREPKETTARSGTPSSGALGSVWGLFRHEL